VELTIAADIFSQGFDSIEGIRQTKTLKAA